ncbi:hydroxymethylbilane synthase, partial [Ornithobacterium rhinotracheale]
DIARVDGEVDLAVHSLKEVPTQWTQGLHLSACLPRGDHRDILGFKSSDILEKEKRTIATWSLRRKAFWHHRVPQDTVVDLRGNVQLR